MRKKRSFPTQNRSAEFCLNKRSNSAEIVKWLASGLACLVDPPFSIGGLRAESGPRKNSIWPAKKILVEK